nr:NADP(+)-dependent isocitrate dehydrogenase, NADP(+)-dependent IDH {peak IV} {EC 1.1.1.42} [rats, ovary, Peptide Partial, 17 aa] [Rattus sp.]
KDPNGTIKNILGKTVVR